VLCRGCEYTVSGFGQCGDPQAIVFTVPPNAVDMQSIISAKRRGLVPKIIRARLAYTVEWVDPPPLNPFDWTYTIYVVDKYGSERVVASEDVFPPTYSRTNDVDITDALGGTTSALGLNAVSIVFCKPVFYPTVVFRYSLRAYGSIGV